MRPTPETGAKRKIDPEAAQSNRSIKTSRSTISSGSKSSSSNNRSHRSTSLIAPAAVVVAPAVVSATSAVEASTVVAAPAVVAVPAAGVPAFVVCGGKSLKKPHVKIEADAETIISSRSTNSVAPAAVIGSPRVIGAPPLVSSAGGVNRHSNSLTGLLKAEIKEESPNEIDYLKLVDQLYTGRQRTEKNNRMRPTDRGAVPENIMEPYNLSFWLGSDAEVASSSRSANSVAPSAVVGLPRVKGAPPLVSSAAGINRHRNSLTGPFIKIEADAETIISSRSANSVAPAAVIGSPRVIEAPPLVSSAGGDNRHSNSLAGPLKAEIKEESPYEIDYLKLVDQLYIGMMMTEKNNRMRPTDRGAVPENILEPYNSSFMLGSDAEVASSSRSANSVAPSAVIGSPRVIEAPPLVSSAGGDNRHSNSLTGPLKAEIKEESPYEIDYLKLVDQLYIGMMMTEKNNRMRPTDRGAVPENILEPYNSSFWLGSDAEVASSSRSANSVAPSAVIGSPRVIGAPPLVSSAGGVNRHSNLLTGPFKAEIKEESPYEIDYLKLVDQLYTGRQRTEKNNRMRPTDQGAVPENIMEPYNLSFWLGSDAEVASSSRSANSVVPSAVVGLPRVKGAPPLVSSAAGINRHSNLLTGPFIKIEADAETIISSRSANSVAPAAVIGSPRVIGAPPLVSSAGGDNRHSNSLTGPLKAEIKEESPNEIDYLKLVDQLYTGRQRTEKNNRMRPTDRGAVPENIMEPYHLSFQLGGDAEAASSSRSTVRNRSTSSSSSSSDDGTYLFK